MQTAIVEVLLNGSLQNTVVREATAAEIVLLRSIHGDDAVVNVTPIKFQARSQAEEIDRLKKFYGDETFKKVFPGSVPKLPMDLSEVINLPSSDDEIKPLKK
jgi:hypothetical protein